MQLDLIGGPVGAYLVVHGNPKGAQMNNPITIRRSTTADAAAVARIAALDSGHVPEGDALLAFVGGELRAVLPLDGGRPLADPFHRTAELVELLRYSVEPDRAPRKRRIVLGRLLVARPGTA
jgi:hypothetical protein